MAKGGSLVFLEHGDNSPCLNSCVVSSIETLDDNRADLKANEETLAIIGERRPPIGCQGIVALIDQLLF